MKTIVIEATPCPSCGKPMPAGLRRAEAASAAQAGALAGLCPACLLAQGVGTDAGDARKGVRFEPPSVADVAKLFPQLEILGLLGTGGMGAVYKARQPALDRMVALKVLPASGAEGVNFEERFNREARALARLSHPNIVAVHEFGKADRLHFFIMEFVDGANLRQLEQAARLAPREALQIIPQICDALQYAHDEGVVHRDIKPENVLVDRKGRVKIADFGLAKILGVDADSLRLTAEGQVMGTPHYMAPEQVEKPLSVDHRADIYSLGVVFYEMLTGDLPLGKFSPPSRKYQLDVRLDDVVLRALENDPARRYQQASEVKTQVENIVGTPPIAASAATPPAPDEHYVRWIGSNVIVEREGKRRVNPKGAFKAFAICFGVITLAFLFVSLITGRTFFGWLGISGALSLQVRLLISVLITAVGVWRVWRRPVGAAQKRTPQGTVVLPRPGLSRKAILGACWAPLFFIAGLLMYTTRSVIRGSGVVDLPAPSTEWWQMLLNATVLPLGAAAPFATTILGWLAVGDIRRGGGRVTGLPLAVFDGLLFPLLVVNALLLWVWTTSVRSLAEAAGNHGFTGVWPAIGAIGSVVICGFATVDISRRVWRAVNQSPRPKTASAARRIAVGVAAILVVATGIVAIVLAMQKAELVRGLVPAKHGVAEFDEPSGALVARLPKRGTASLLAVSDSGAQPNAWWRPDGVAIPDTLFDVRAQSELINTAFKTRDFVVRWKDLPSGAGGPWLRVEPAAGGSVSGGGRVVRDGKELSNAWLVRATFSPSTTKATVWLGFGLDAWRTIGTYAGNGQSSEMRVLPGVPSLQGRLHQISEEGNNVVVTLLMEREQPDWRVQVVAVDTNGQEHAVSSGAATTIESKELWTYRFKVPRAQVREFQVQVRPVHWIEFRNVPIEPKERSSLAKSARTFKPTAFSELAEVHVTSAFDFDAGRLAEAPPTIHVPPDLLFQTAWARTNGLDAVFANNQLCVNGMEIADLAPSEWERQEAGRLSERLQRSAYAPSRLPPRPGLPLTPLAYAFRTRDGTLGMMQLVGFGEGRPGIVVRYKVVKRAHFE